MSKSTLLGIIAFFIVSTTVTGHGINFETEKYPPVVKVKSFFSATSPVIDARVMIYAPGETDPFQTGYTDRDGFFSFVPDTQGEWVFGIDDGMGHASRITITVGSDFFAPEEDPVADVDKEQEAAAVETTASECVFMVGIPVIYRVLFGLALIFGITGIFYGIKTRQAAKKQQ